MEKQNILDDVMKKIQELEIEKKFYFEQLKELFKTSEYSKKENCLRVSRLIETNKLYTISQYMEVIEEEEQLMDAFYSNVERTLELVYEAEEVEKNTKNYTVVFNEE